MLHFTKKLSAYYRSYAIDIFVYDPQQEAYLLVYRKNSPAKNTWWYPGRRLYKGESFFEAAKRKCWDEVQLRVSPVAQLNTYSTIFPDSKWNSPTHTINIAILVIKDADQIPQLDHDHQGYEWRSLQKSPGEDFYLSQIYKEAIKYMSRSLRKN